jgi:phosphoribosylamine---glycine ligase
MNVLPLLKANFAEICRAVADGKLDDLDVQFEKKATVCKYVVPEGYPEKGVSGKIVVSDTRALTYYAAVEEKDDGIYTTGSRAVALVGIADTIEEAEKTAEDAASRVEGAVYHRRDIGTQELVQKRISHIKEVMRR